MKNADALDLPTLIAAILSTKGGVAKTTDTANLGGYLADQGLKVLMIDADIRQPTLSSYYPLDNEAPGGIYGLSRRTSWIQQPSSHTPPFPDLISLSPTIHAAN